MDINTYINLYDNQVLENKIKLCLAQNIHNDKYFKNLHRAILEYIIEIYKSIITYSLKNNYEIIYDEYRTKMEYKNQIISNYYIPGETAKLEVEARLKFKDIPDKDGYEFIVSALKQIYDDKHSISDQISDRLNSLAENSKCSIQTYSFISLFREKYINNYISPITVNISILTPLKYDKINEKGKTIDWLKEYMDFDFGDDIYNWINYYKEKTANIKPHFIYPDEVYSMEVSKYTIEKLVDDLCIDADYVIESGDYEHSTAWVTVDMDMFSQEIGDRWYKQFCELNGIRPIRYPYKYKTTYELIDMMRVYNGSEDWPSTDDLIDDEVGHELR